MKSIIFFALLICFFTPAKAYSVEVEKASNRVQILPPKKDEEEYSQLVKEAEKAKDALDLTKLIDVCGGYTKNISFEEGRKCFDKVYEIAKKNFEGKSGEITTIHFIIDNLARSGDYDEAEKRLELFKPRYKEDDAKYMALSSIVSAEAYSAAYYKSEDFMNRALNNLNKIFDKKVKEHTISMIVGDLYKLYGKEEAFKALNLLSDKKRKEHGLIVIASAMVYKGEINEALEIIKDVDEDYKFKQFLYVSIARHYINKNDFDKAQEFIKKVKDNEEVERLESSIKYLNKHTKKR